MQSIENIVDEAAYIAVLDSKGRIVRKNAQGQGKRGETGVEAYTGQVDVDWKNAWSEGTDAVMDVPIGGVCEVLYGDG